MTGGAPRLGPPKKGHGAPRMGRPPKDDCHSGSNIGMYQPPPFIGTWEEARKGGGKKKNQKNGKNQERDYCWEKTVHSKTYLS